MPYSWSTISKHLPFSGSKDAGSFTTTGSGKDEEAGGVRSGRGGSGVFCGLSTILMLTISALIRTKNNKKTIRKGFRIIDDFCCRWDLFRFYLMKSSEDGIRRRLVSSSTLSADSTKQGFVENLKQYDVYPKVAQDVFGENDSHERTTSGAIISMISCMIMLVLIFYEFKAFTIPVRREHMVVDTTSARPLDIHFDITFHAIPCPDLRVDALDITGMQQVNVLRSVHKQRLDLDGNSRGAAYVDNPDQDEYRAIVGLGIMKHFSDTKTVKLSNEGCNLVGKLVVHKVAGNFHFALGKGLRYGSRHVHHFEIDDIKHFNTSHTINELRFGPNFSGIANPLSKHQRILPEIVSEEAKKGSDGSESLYTGHFEYYLDVVPTNYVNRFGVFHYTSQYAFSEKFTKVETPEPGSNMRIPGVFFIYKISPFMVEVVDEVTTFFHFLTSLCAIIGGVVSIASLVDTIVYFAPKILSASPSSSKLQ